MDVFLKKKSTFETISNFKPTNINIIQSGTQDNAISRFTCFNDAISMDNIGDWIVYDGALFLIVGVSPNGGLMTVECSSADTAFSRTLVYSSTNETTIEGFIASILESEYKNQPDADYAIPYLSITATRSTPIIYPYVDENNFYSLKTYIRLVERKYGVNVDFEVGNYGLSVNIAPATPAKHYIIFGDETTKLIGRAQSAASVAKVTVIQPNTTSTWYLSTDGTISATPPTSRARGEWQTVMAEDTDVAQTVARNIFNDNTAAHKVEFYVEKQMALYDPVIFKFENGDLLESVVSEINKNSDDVRLRVVAGELATTLTDKLKGVMR